MIAQKEERIDKYITDNTDYTRSTVQKMIKENYILVNNKKVKNNYILKIGDNIEIKDGFIKEMEVLPEKIKLDIVYEDNDLMVINKPSGMVVHPGNGNTNHTLVNALMGYTNNLSTSDFRPGIVHRIDKDTSGLMLVAKNDKTHLLLQEGFKNKTIKREYTALLIGNLEHNEVTIDAPIIRDINSRKKMSVGINGKKAITHMKVLKRYNGYTLVNCTLETGRTHQIRVHAKYINHPVYNDPVYTNNKCTSFGQFLHSREITFTHPISKKELHFAVDVPKEFKDFLNNL